MKETQETQANSRVNSVTFTDNTKVLFSDFTLLIGPNNVGKSRAIKDIINQMSKETTGSIILKEVDYHVNWNYDDYMRNCHVRIRSQVPHSADLLNSLSSDLVAEKWVGKQVSTEWQDLYVQSKKNNLPQWRKLFGEFLVSHCTTEQRLRLISSIPSAETQVNRNLLKELYHGGRPFENIVNEIIRDAFSKEITLDYSALASLTMRVGTNFSELPADPREFRQKLSGEMPIDEEGDGIKCFVGLVLATLLLNRPFLLIDEPEAFLHSPQAFRIGRFLSLNASANKQIIVASHSVDVLRGVLSTNKSVTIVRLDRANGVTRANVLKSDMIKEIDEDPLLSSSRVLGGLFSSGSVVVEGDSDVRFYSAAMARKFPESDTYFVNAANKQTVPKILSIYRSMGVRSAGIVDIDAINDKREFRSMVASVGIVSVDEQSHLESDRLEIEQEINSAPAIQRYRESSLPLREAFEKFNASQSIDVNKSGAIEILLKEGERYLRTASEQSKPWRPLKEQGKSSLSSGSLKCFESIYHKCSRSGLFINPHGVLESMLSDQGIPYSSNKKEWIIRAITLVQNLDTSLNKFLWDFVSTIKSYLEVPTDSSLNLSEDEVRSI